MYSVGSTLRISLFGRSHAPRVGCVLEGVPAGVPVDEKQMQEEMDLRRPSDGIGTARREADIPVLTGGVSEGRTTGGPIMITIENRDCDGSAYAGFSDTPRPGHADLPALFRFRDFDISGGAQFSGRMTAPLVAAGAIAKSYLSGCGVKVAGYTRSVHKAEDPEDRSFDEIAGSRRFPTRAASAHYDDLFRKEIEDAASQQDSVGGVVTCCAVGIPIGTGGMWFDALDVSLSRMLFSIPGVKGVSFGKGFGITRMKGSESNDGYRFEDGITAESNNMGGVVGGMSDGMPLVFHMAVKPTPSIGSVQHTVSLSRGENADIRIEGRHDPCIAPRAVAVAEAVSALCIADQMLTFRPASLSCTGP